MPKNKNAQARYIVIDRCLKSKVGVTLESIRQRCCFELGYDDDGIKTRTIQKDLNEDFQSIYPDAEIIREKRGSTWYYRYKDPLFSITPKKLTQTDKECLIQVLKMLKCFDVLALQGISESVQEIIETSNIDDTSKSVVSYEQNPYFKNLELIPGLFDAIINKIVISVKYKPFGVEVNEHIIHPYYIKQYNKRWYLFGYERCEDGRYLTNLGLDRIESYTLCPNIEYKESNIDFEEYFDDIIGVTKKKDQLPIKILLAVDKTRSKYVKSNPLHGSHTELHEVPEKYYSLSSQYDFFSYSVIENNELINTLLHLGKDAIVLEPIELRERMKTIFEESINNYNKII